MDNFYDSNKIFVLNYYFGGGGGIIKKLNKELRYRGIVGGGIKGINWRIIKIK